MKKVDFTAWQKKKDKEMRQKKKKIQRELKHEQRRKKSAACAKEQRYEELREELRKKRSTMTTTRTSTVKFLERNDEDDVEAENNPINEMSESKLRLQERLRRARMDEWLAKKDLERAREARRGEEEQQFLRELQKKNRAEKWRLKPCILSYSMNA